MVNEEHLVLLYQGVKAWNHWRQEHPEIIPDLSKANLYQINLNDFNLQKVNFCQANLSGASLIGTQLNQANLQGANLLSANLEQANLKGANLDLAILKQTIINSETILDSKVYKIWEFVNQGATNQNLSNLDLSYANLFQVDFSNSDLSKANLSHANLSNTNFNSAYLSHANLTDANLYRANLNNTYLSHANLTNANLTQASLIGTYLRDAIADFVNFKATKINYQTLIDYKYYLVWELVNQGGIQKSLVGADLSNANLKGVDFSKADLTKTNFGNSDLRGCDLSHANLTRTNFSRANLIGVNFNQTDLKSANLSGAIRNQTTQFNDKLPTQTTIANSESVEYKEYETQIQLVEREVTLDKGKLSKLELSYIFILLMIIIVTISSYIIWCYENNKPILVPTNLEKIFQNKK